MQAVFGALAQVVPDRISAASEGGTSTGRFGFLQPDGTTRVFYDNVYGIQGALPVQDGVSGVSSVLANLSNVSIEVLESQVPLRIRSYGLVPDTGGPGQFRGGQAIRRTWEVLHGCNFTFRSDRRAYPPYGLMGGGHGAASTNILNPDKEAKLLPTKINVRLNQGDVFLHNSPGGGGYGNPLERDPQMVLQDWRDGRVTAAHAREVYSVAIDEKARAVNEAETAELRASARS